jgi:CDGSH-type Zn-finger protein
VTPEREFAPGLEPARPGKERCVADETTITPYRDGPLLVRGSFRLLDQDGNAIENDREVVALCRCGKSRIRPFCDGSHKIVRFKAPSGAERGREAAADEARGYPGTA